MTLIDIYLYLYVVVMNKRQSLYIFIIVFVCLLCYVKLFLVRSLCMFTLFYEQLDWLDELNVLRILYPDGKWCFELPIYALRVKP